MSKQIEIFERVAARIIEQLEEAAPKAWRAPWHARPGTSSIRPPANAFTDRPYRGVNTVILWAAALGSGYATDRWATYRQWAEHGCQVRKGEKGTTVILWKPYERTQVDDDGTVETVQSVYARTFTVFNADQVDGYNPPARPEPDGQHVVRTAQAFFAQLGAAVRYGGSRAYYSPVGDYIVLPDPATFVSPVAYHATQAHEHVHWASGAGWSDR